MPVPWKRLIRFVPPAGTEILFGDAVADSHNDLGRLASEGKLQARVVQCGADGPLSSSCRLTEEVVSVGRLLGPLTPSITPDIKCIGLNYKAHILEGGRAPPPYPSLFTKPTTCLADYGEAIVVPKCAQDREADYEVELVAVIGRDCKDVQESNALGYVAGYTIGNDITARKWQRFPDRAGGAAQWCFGKSFDRFCPLGPCIVSAEVIPDPSKLNMSLEVNGEQRQETPVSDLLFDVRKLIAFLSQGTTLRQGTIIMTGTPSGVGCTGNDDSTWKPLLDGDELELTISGIGVLRHSIKYE